MRMESHNRFNFPWNNGDTWEFTLLGEYWSAETTGSTNGMAVVKANSDSGHTLEYHLMEGMVSWTSLNGRTKKENFSLG